MAGRQSSRSCRSRQLLPNPAGAHFLTDRRLIGQLVDASGIGQGDLVFDFGAGYGALTGPLAATGARVIAVEIDPALAGRLRRRFAAQPLVGVVEADLRRIPLPRRQFHVVANPPFALTTWLCRRLLGDRTLRLIGAELLLEWGAAKWLADPSPRDRETASWMARYDIRLINRVPAASFSPRPSADAAHVSISRRAGL
ncbi:MAG TPA: rRNA adenine N(6)-methyltransferase family protein [Streptosporangiaceae bacterium]|nr:rRNA adenine N(6)-methyltransferase family protein [Streptosporangiaceae bacterium]